MRIAIVTAFPREPDFPQGGVEAVSVNLVRALCKREDLEVHVLTTDRSLSVNSVSDWSRAKIHRLARRKCHLLTYSTGEGRKQVQAYLQRLNPHVVHAHDTYGIMIKGVKLPRVFTIHGFIHEDTIYGKERFARLRSLLWRRVELANWAEQPHIISISPYVRERLRGTAQGKIHDIENPIAPEYFSVRRSEQPGTIFCAAAICERKNTLGLVKAFALLAEAVPQARLRLAGDGVDSDYGLSVRSCVEQYGLTKRVAFLGSISMEQVRQELAQASIFALISFEEGAPMGIAEAMAAGVPVVTSNRCGMPYMVRQGETGLLVEPDTPQAAAAGLRELLENAKLRSQMSQRAREIAFDRFHPDRVADRTLDVYRRCVVAHNQLDHR